MQRPLFKARENQQITAYNLGFFPILHSTRCYKGVRITRLLSFSD